MNITSFTFHSLWSYLNLTMKYYKITTTLSIHINCYTEATLYSLFISINLGIFVFWTIYFLVERDTLLKEQLSIASWGVSHSSLVSTRLRPMSVKTNTNQLFVIRPESHLLCKRTAQQRQNIKSTYLKNVFFYTF